MASGLFKAVWFLVPPILLLARGRPVSERLCQGTGFLLSVGIEASGSLALGYSLWKLAYLMSELDFIILLIAAHTALAVLRSAKSNGLYNYRWSAYTCWILVALLLPSLAFVNGHEAYISQGTFCYLPIRPIWYRLALAWVPRYIVLCVILTTYLTIYIYTVHEFGKFDISLNSGSDLFSSGKGKTGGAHIWTRPIPWFRPPIKDHPSAPEEPPADVMLDPIAPVKSARNDSSATEPSPYTIREPTLLEALQDKSFAPGPRDSAVEHNFALRKRHRAIQRQLRYMFIYPLVYLLIWLPPFASHCYYYTREHNPPFVLSCVSISCISLQCAVDCWLFNLRERPWRRGPDRAVSVDHSTLMSDGSIPAKERVRNGSEAFDTSYEVDGQNIGRFGGGRVKLQPRQEKHWWDNEPM